METKTLKEISKMDSPALTAVIDFWKDYDPTSVLLAFAELKARNFSLPERLTRRQNDFCAKYNHPNMDAFLSNQLKEIGYNSYSEYYEKEIGTRKIEIVEDIIKPTYNISENVRERYPALRTIAGIYMVFAWIVGITAIIVTFYFLTTDSGKIFALIALVFGGLIVLGLAAISESIKVFLDIEHNTRQKKNNE